MKLPIPIKLPLLIIALVSLPFLLDIISLYYHISMFTHLLVFAVVAAGALIWSIYYQKKSFAKLKELQRITRAIADGHLDRPNVPFLGSDEYVILADSIEYMRQNLLKAHQALTESEGRYRELVETSNALLVKHDMKGRILSINKTACEALGYQPEELVGKAIPDMMEPAVGPYFQFYLDDIKLKGKTTGLITLLHRDGHKQVWRFHNTLNSTNPDFPVVYSSGFDVTQQLKLEMALTESEERYRQIVEYSPVGIYVHQEGKIGYVNKAALDILGYERSDEILGKPVQEIICPEDRSLIKGHMEQVLEKGQIAPLKEESVNRRDGSMAIIESMSIPFTFNRKNAILSFVRDITEHKRLEKQLIQAQKMDAIGQLAGGIAHDFNNILSGITGYTSLMKMKMDESNPFYAGITIIEKAAWRAAELIRQLLGFARGGKYEVKLIDLNTVVNNVLEIISQTFDRAIAINTNLFNNIWTIEGDPGQLEQVILNICLNARDAMQSGGRLTIETSNIILDEIYTRSHLEAKGGDYVLLAISDTGTGIPIEIQGKIFEPFFTTKEIGQGTGMGLAMAYGIIKNHDGFITLYSEAGSGTCFKIYLPAVKKAVTEETNFPSETIPTGKGTILLVDDEEMVRELGQDILVDLGYQVILARDGKEACAIFSEKSNQIDLVLLDMIMPEMGGTETYHQLKKINSQIKILFCSGYTAKGQALNILSEGVQGFVQKPFNLQQLAQSVSKALKST